MVPVVHGFASRPLIVCCGRGCRSDGMAGTRRSTSFSRRLYSPGLGAAFACSGRGRVDIARVGRGASRRPRVDPPDVHGKSALGRPSNPRRAPEVGNFGESVDLAKYMRRQPRPPSQTWRPFLTNHGNQIMAADFFAVPTVTFRLLFVLVILEHERRRLVHVAVTEHPTAAGTAQQLRNAFSTTRYRGEHKEPSPRAYGLHRVLPALAHTSRPRQGHTGPAPGLTAVGRTHCRHTRSGRSTPRVRPQCRIAVARRRSSNSQVPITCALNASVLRRGAADVRIPERIVCARSAESQVCGWALI